MRLLRVLHLVGVVARSLGQVPVAVALADHRASRVDGGVRQRGAIGPHIGDEALFIKPLGGAHRHGRTHAELAARFLLERRGDERGGWTAPVGLRLAGANLVGNTFEIVNHCRGLRLVEHDDIITRELAVIVEVAAAGETNFVDRGEVGLELALVFTSNGGECTSDIPVAGGNESHTFTFTRNNHAGSHRLHPTRRQLRHDLLPQHRRNLVAIQAIEDPACFLRVDHLAIEFARRIHSCLNRLLGDLVEHHALDRHLRIQHLVEVPGDRFALTILIRCEINLVGIFHQTLQELDVVFLVAVLDIKGLEVVVDIDPCAGPLLTFVGGRYVRGVARKVPNMADR